VKPLAGFNELILFLDFDGVLQHENVLWHPRRGAYLFAPARYTLFQHVPLLEQVLEPYPEVKIVLSTSWVVRCGYSKTLKRLPVGLRERCIGATYHSQMLGDSFKYLPRGEQVSNDAARRRPRGWLALDDDVIGWPDATKANLVQTDPYEGISETAVLEELTAKLAFMCSTGWYEAEGEVGEVLSTFGLANILCQDGKCYAVNRTTPGVQFDALEVGMRVRCRVADKFSRVLYARVVG
jgi:HAD domain in Swiss Army Knife RNA repair proteins